MGAFLFMISSTDLSIFKTGFNDTVQKSSFRSGLPEFFSYKHRNLKIIVNSSGLVDNSQYLSLRKINIAVDNT